MLILKNTHITLLFIFKHVFRTSQQYHIILCTHLLSLITLQSSLRKYIQMWHLCSESAGLLFKARANNVYSRKELKIENCRFVSTHYKNIAISYTKWKSVHVFWLSITSLLFIYVLMYLFIPLFVYFKAYGIAHWVPLKTRAAYGVWVDIFTLLPRIIF